MKVISSGERKNISSLFKSELEISVCWQRVTYILLSYRLFRSSYHVINFFWQPYQLPNVVFDSFKAEESSILSSHYCELCGIKGFLSKARHHVHRASEHSTFVVPIYQTFVIFL